MNKKNLPVKFIESTDSTNRYLSDLIKNNDLSGIHLSDFFTIFADYQTDGHGLEKNSWASNEGENILASMFYSPPLLPENQFIFNQFFALSVRKFLLNYIPEIQIKWPNDIYVNNKKIAGILIEHTIRGNRIANTIAGVGINVNQTHFPRFVRNPTSIKQHCQQALVPKKLIYELIDCCKYYYPFVITQNYAKIQQEYLDALYRYKEMAPYDIKGVKLTAAIQGIDNFGQLLLKDDKNQEYCCGFKEIKFIV